jgi:hypothetical protein
MKSANWASEIDRLRWFLFTLALVFAQSACSDSAPGGAENGSGIQTDGSTAQPQHEVPACAALEMKPEAHAVTFEVGTTLDPGEELELCSLQQIGSEDIWLNSTDLVLTTGSHHGLLWLTSYTELPDTDLAGNPIELGKTTPCPGGANGQYAVTRPIAGSQGRFNLTAPGVLPSDVAMKVPANAYVVTDLHMLNAKDTPADACMKVGINSVPRAQVKQEAGVLFFYDPFIAIPAGGTARARMACPITQDIMLKSAVSHMHKHAIGYEASLLDGDPFEPKTKTLMSLYRTTEWDSPEDTLWNAPLALKAGQFIDYHCDYENKTDRDVAQGLQTRDEMCMLEGVYWPNDQGLGFCAQAGGTVNDSGANGYEIGSGDLDGAGFLGCFWGADYAGGATEQCGLANCKNNSARYQWQSCFTRACSAIGRYTRPFLNCIGGKGADCDTRCDAQDSNCIFSCFQETCKPEIDALNTTECD